MRRNLVFFLIFFTLAVKADETLFRTGLTVKSAERFRRSAFHIDPVEELIVKGVWAPPLAGQDVVYVNDGTVTNRSPGSLTEVMRIGRSRVAGSFVT